jgi:hypothetical protein
VYEWKDKGRVKKEVLSPYFPTLFFPSFTFLPFVLFSYGNVNAFGLRFHPIWEKDLSKMGKTYPLYREYSSSWTMQRQHNYTDTKQDKD